MGKSKRKPIITCGYGGSARAFFKRLSNKRIRSYEKEISTGGHYKKIAKLSWDICDYKIWVDPKSSDYRKANSK